MEDEKYGQALGGLQGSGFSYICTLCYATSQTAQEELGYFKIEKTLEDTHYMASYIRANPDNLSEHSLTKLAKGVKSLPVLTSEL